MFKARDRKNKHKVIWALGHIEYLSLQHSLVLTMTLNQVVALKKVLMENEKEGFPITALRFFCEVLQSMLETTYIGFDRILKTVIIITGRSEFCNYCAMRTLSILSRFAEQRSSIEKGIDQISGRYG